MFIRIRIPVFSSANMESRIHDKMGVLVFVPSTEIGRLPVRGAVYSEMVSVSHDLRQTDRPLDDHQRNDGHRDKDDGDGVHRRIKRLIDIVENAHGNRHVGR